MAGTPRKRASSRPRTSKKAHTDENGVGGHASSTPAADAAGATSDGETETMMDDGVALVVSKPVSAKSVITRTTIAVAMVCAYMLMLCAGHFYCILVVVMIQFELFRELVNVRYIPAKERAMPMFRTLQWSWFVTAMWWVYGERLHVFFEEKETFHWLLPLTSRTAQITFALYCVLFVTSVLNLRSSMVKFQLSQYMWTIVIICLVVLQCKFFASYTLKGLFWFWFPMACVVMNDVSAYFCGITMGKKFIRRPFFRLSPSKSWEGFLGAAVLTIVFSFLFPRLVSRWTLLTCPAEGLYLTPFPPPLSCEPHWVFVKASYELPFTNPFGAQTVTLLPIQLHGLAYGLFASLIAPFGGFFASAIKRAYDLKDFDNIFPGHGGIMDRMDCQLFMMAFTSFHYKFFIRDVAVPTVAQVLASVATMPPQEQLKVIERLAQLTGTGYRVVHV